MTSRTFRIAALVVASGFVSAAVAQAGTFLVNQRNASTIWSWESGGGTTAVFHETTANDADLNPGQGSTYGWIAEHFDDNFGRFIPGTGTGLDAEYTLGVGGRTHYHYPKHITVYDNNIVVMSRNDATIWRYDENGSQLGSTATGNGTGQGMATDGNSFYASFWNGSNSFFQRYDSNFILQETIANPSGMGAMTNIVDFAYDAATGHFFGLATNFEGGTGTETNTVFEFAMGGAVVDSYTLPFLADGIGQIPEPTTLSMLALGALAAVRRRV